MRRDKGKVLSVIASVILFLILFLILYFENGGFTNNEKGTQEKLSVHFIDVGQGDGALIRSGGEAMLIDCGIYENSENIISYLKRQGVRKLKYVIATHPHSDHIGAMEGIIQTFPIETFFKTNVERDTKPYRYMMRELNSHKATEVVNPAVGDTYKLGEASFTFIAPVYEDYGDNINNTSIGIRLECGSRSFVMYGDGEMEAELDMVENGIKPADVLKVSHHGSKGSSAHAMLDALRPSYAVISCGKDNSYNHPNKKIVKRLEERGIKVLRTDLRGTVVFYCDGERVWYE